MLNETTGLKFSMSYFVRHSTSDIRQTYEKRQNIQDLARRDELVTSDGHCRAL